MAEENISEIQTLPRQEIFISQDLFSLTEEQEGLLGAGNSINRRKEFHEDHFPYSKIEEEREGFLIEETSGSRVLMFDIQTGLLAFEHKPTGSSDFNTDVYIYSRPLSVTAEYNMQKGEFSITPMDEESGTETKPTQRGEPCLLLQQATYTVTPKGGIEPSMIESRILSYPDGEKTIYSYVLRDLPKLSEDFTSQITEAASKSRKLAVNAGFKIS